MLSGVPASISPELLKVLHEMGHGDTLVIGDANFPAASIAAEKNHINIRCDGHRATDMLDAILQLMPLDGFVEKPVTIMDKMEMHRDLKCLFGTSLRILWQNMTNAAQMQWALWTGSRSMTRQRMPMRWYPPQRRHFTPAL